MKILKYGLRMCKQRMLLLLFNAQKYLATISRIKLSLAIFMASMLCSTIASAEPIRGVDQIMLQLKAGFAMCGTLACIIGVALFCSGLFKLKKHGQMAGNMMSQGSSATGPVLCLLMASFMMCLPFTINTLLNSFWGTSIPSSDYSNTALKPVLFFVRLIGVVSLMRGIVMLSRYTGDSGGQGSVGKAVMTIIVAICLMHIVGTAKVVNSICGNLLG